jgi:hypothetical protein
MTREPIPRAICGKCATAPLIAANTAGIPSLSLAPRSSANMLCLASAKPEPLMELIENGGAAKAQEEESSTPAA